VVVIVLHVAIAALRADISPRVINRLPGPASDLIGGAGSSTQACGGKEDGADATVHPDARVAVESAPADATRASVSPVA
jgi:hypothetical protein